MGCLKIHTGINIFFEILTNFFYQRDIEHLYAPTTGFLHLTKPKSFRKISCEIFCNISLVQKFLRKKLRKRFSFSRVFI